MEGLGMDVTAVVKDEFSASFGGTAEPLDGLWHCWTTWAIAALVPSDARANVTAALGCERGTRVRRPPAKRDGRPAPVVGGAVCAEWHFECTTVAVQLARHFRRPVR